MDIGLRLQDQEQTLTDVSYDKVSAVSLIDSGKKIYNFDLTTKFVCKKLRNGNNLSSCDGLLLRDGNFVLIEFKHQKPTKIDKTEIIKKAYDSFTTIRMIIDQTISVDELRAKSVLFVVFEDEKGFPDFQKKLYQLAKPGEEPILFGLSCVKDTLYQRIYTLSISDFSKMWISALWGE